MAPGPDSSGKHAFDDIYDAPDPRPYWRALAPLDYVVPHHAQGVYAQLVAARRQHGGDQVTVTDLCCSYGTTAALLKHDCTLEELTGRYCSPELATLSSDELAAHDTAFYAPRRLPSPARVIGVDTASSAVAYGLRSGLLDAGAAENLEEAQASNSLSELLAGTDIVTVTGGVGYIGERTFDRVLSPVPEDRRPWVAAFVLRWIDYTGIAQTLARHGLVTEQLRARTFPQRRFADEAERDFVLSKLSEMGLEPDGKEADGYHHASLYLSRPAEDATAAPVEHWFA